MIFFDLDGTLIDHEKAAKLAVTEIWKRYRCHLIIDDSDDFFVLWNTIVDDRMAKSQSGSFLDEGVGALRAVLATAGCAISAADCRSEFAAYLADYECSCTAYNDVVPALQKLVGTRQRLGIISNGDRDLQLAKMDRVNVTRFFEEIVFSRDLGVEKPDVRLFHHACDLAGVAPVDCYFVGDNFSIDIRGSSNAGMKPIWINRNNACRVTEVSHSYLSSFPLQEIRSLSELETCMLQSPHVVSLAGSV